MNSLLHLLEVLSKKPYTYSKHFVPHDASAHELSTGLSRVEVAKGLGFTFTVASKLPVMEGIDAARAVFNLETAIGPSKKVQGFDSESLAMGVEHSQMVKATHIASDDGSKDCAFLPAPIAVSRFNRRWFDESRCSKGISALENYKKEWNERLGCWDSKPLHNFASHGADVFRILVITLKEPDKRAMTAEVLDENYRQAMNTSRGSFFDVISNSSDKNS